MKCFRLFVDSLIFLDLGLEKSNRREGKRLGISDFGGKRERMVGFLPVDFATERCGGRREREGGRDGGFIKSKGEKKRKDVQRLFCSWRNVFIERGFSLISLSRFVGRAF